MAKLIILSDSHTRHRLLDHIVAEEEPYDKVIHLGDIFHMYGDSPEDNRDAALWMRDRLDDPRWVLIAGNHDLCPAYPLNDHIWHRSDGDHEGITRAIRSILTDAHFARQVPCYLCPDTHILFSHAGIDARLPPLVAPFMGMPLPEMTAVGLDSWVRDLWPAVTTRLRAGRDHPLVAMGVSRGGVQRVGGIVWECFTTHKSIPNVLQILGHTVQQCDVPLWRFPNGPTRDSPPMWRRAGVGTIHTEWLAKGGSLGLDTANKHYAVIDSVERTLSIKEILKVRPTSVGQPMTAAPGRVISKVVLPS